MSEDLDWVDDDLGSYSHTENQLLDKICGKHLIPTQLFVKLLDVERQIQGMTRRSSAYPRIENVLKQEWRTEEQIMKDTNGG